jgi:hypothetical protein
MKDIIALSAEDGTRGKARLQSGSCNHLGKEWRKNKGDIHITNRGFKLFRRRHGAATKAPALRISVSLSLVQLPPPLYLALPILYFNIYSSSWPR